MKLNKIILVSIFLLAILTLSPLCASNENTADAISTQDDSPISTEKIVVLGDEELDEGDPDDDPSEGEGDLEEDGDFDEDETSDEWDDTQTYYNITYPNSMIQGTDEYLVIEMPEDATGNMIVLLNDVAKYNGKASGKITVPLKSLTVDDPYIDIEYDGDDNYDSIYDHYEANVFKISYSKSMYVNKNYKITLTGPYDFYGKFAVTLDGNTKSVSYDPDDGDDCYLTIKPTSTGSKTAKYTIKNKKGEVELNGTLPITVAKQPIIEAKDFTMYCHQTKYYKIRLLDGNKKAIAGKSVTFYLDGIKVKSVKTDSKGYAKLKLTKQSPFKYKIKTSYDGVSVTKKLTVKGILGSFKKATVKNAKKLTVQIKTNKVNGKYLKGKYVTFKFNGKKYKGKINSKGIAKVSIPQKAFAKCKTSKTYYYYIEASYGNDVNYVFIMFSKVKPKLSYKLLLRVSGAGGA